MNYVQILKNILRYSFLAKLLAQEPVTLLEKNTLISVFQTPLTQPKGDSS